MLAAGSAIAHEAERLVPVPTDLTPEFLTPPSDDGYIDGQNDPIPELTEKAIVAFFGDRRLRVLNDSTLAEQLMEALDGPPFDQIDLENGYYVYVACKMHNCGERGAVIMDESGRIVAAEIIGYRCRQKPVPACDDQSIAYAFLSSELDYSFVERIFVEWAAMSFDEVDQTNRDYFPELPSVDRMLHIVGS